MASDPIDTVHLQPDGTQAPDETARRQQVLDEIVEDAEPEMVDMRSLGTSGLNQYGGFINEEIERQLQGREAARQFKQMRLNDPSAGTMLWFTKALVRTVNWTVAPASQEQHDVDNAEFIDSCLHDMDQPFGSYVDEHMSMLEYGFAPCEILLKHRLGQAPEPWLRSKYTDGRIGLRALPLRAQETIYQWEFDDAGGVTAMFQQAPPQNQIVRIPMAKVALFRTTNLKGSPEGESVLRRAWRSYYMKCRLQNLEAIGIERDLAGYPVMRMPYRMMGSAATPEEKKQYKEWCKMITRMRRGEQEGSVIPSMYDANGNQMFELKLLSSGGSRQMNVGEVINRYDDEILRCLMADFMKLGSSGTSAGSWAMHSDKTQMFLQGVSVFLAQIAQVYNQTIIPKLIRLNGLAATDYPTLEFTPLEKVDSKQMADTLLALAQSGMPIWPNEALQQRMFDMLGVASPVDPDRQARIRDTMPVDTRDPSRMQLEIPHGAPKDFQPDKEQLTGDAAKDSAATGVNFIQHKV